MNDTIERDRGASSTTREHCRVSASTQRQPPPGRIVAMALRAFSIFCVGFGLLIVLFAWFMGASGDASGASGWALVVSGIGMVASMGLPSIWFGALVWRSVRDRVRRDALDPNGQEMRRQDPERGRIASREAVDPQLALIVACVLLGGLASFFVGAWLGGEFFLAGLFLATTVGLWWLPVRGLLRRARFGTSVLHLDRVPVVVGGSVTGVVQFSRPIGQGTLDPVRTQLRIRGLRTRRARQQSVVLKQSVHYEEVQEKSLAGDLREFPVAFEIPGTERATDTSNSRRPPSRTRQRAWISQHSPCHEEGSVQRMRPAPP